jgi:hypothetical protein
MFSVFPLKTHVQVVCVMRSLHIDQDTAAFAGDGCWFDFFTGNDLLANIDFFIFMALETAISLFKGAFAAMITAFLYPLK